MENNLTNLNEIDVKKYSSIVLQYVYPKFKRKPQFTQYYKINVEKECLVGGLREKGYELLFAVDGSCSCTVITNRDIEKLLQGDTLEINTAKVRILQEEQENYIGHIS